MQVASCSPATAIAAKHLAWGVPWRVITSNTHDLQCWAGLPPALLHSMLTAVEQGTEIHSPDPREMLDHPLVGSLAAPFSL